MWFIGVKFGLKGGCGISCCSQLGDIGNCQGVIGGFLFAVMWFTSDTQLTTVDSRGITVVNCRGCGANGDYCGTKIGAQWFTAGTGMVLETTVTCVRQHSGLVDRLG